VLALLISVPASLGADAPIYGYFFLRYTYDNPFNPDSMRDKDHANAFSIERGYIRWKTSTTPVSVSGTVDLTMKSKATGASDWNVRLKYAQADWFLPYIGKVLPDTKLSLGLQKVFFGTTDIWEYPLIEKSLEDAQGKISSADLGLGLNGFLPAGYGDFAVQLFNGTGYSSAVENDINKAVNGNLSLVPPTIIPGIGIMLKVSYWMDMNKVKYYSAADSETLKVDLDRNRYAVVGKLKFKWLTMLGEYLGTQDGSTPDDKITEGKGWSVFGEIAPVNWLGLLARYDMWDKNVTDTAAAAQNDAITTLIGGLNLKVSNELLLQFNYQKASYQDTTRLPVDKFMVQAKYSF
jgi:hypothetical protein